MDFAPSELWSDAARRDRQGFYARVRDAGEPVPQIEPGSGRRFWVVAGHRDVVEGLQHPYIGHEVEKHIPRGHPRRDTVRRYVPDPVSARQLIYLDPPDHTRLRRLATTGFGPRTVERLEPWICDVVDQLLARIPRHGVVDAVAQLATPVPVAIIAELVGVPLPDRARFRAWSTAIVCGGPAASAATAEFARYIDELAARRKACPTDDLVSQLVALEDDLEDDAGRLDRQELVALVLLLLIAGQETTVELISRGILALLTHPGQWHALRDDRGLAAAAVEEILRFDGSVEIAPPRFAFTDIQIAGGTIPAFETVALSIFGANHDPAVFAEPGRFNIHRGDVRHHVAFGRGPHFCLGAPLARLEGRIMFERLPVAFPDLSLAVEPEAVRQAQPRLTELPLRTLRFVTENGARPEPRVAAPASRCGVRFGLGGWCRCRGRRWRRTGCCRRC